MFYAMWFFIWEDNAEFSYIFKACMIFFGNKYKHGGKNIANFFFGDDTFN